jgi:hypothetical protein
LSTISLSYTHRRLANFRPSPVRTISSMQAPAWIAGQARNDTLKLQPCGFAFSRARMLPAMMSTPGMTIIAQMIFSRFILTQGTLPKK